MSNHEEQQLQKHATNARNLVSSVEINPMTDGISFLDMKNDTLLSYLIDLTNITLKQLKRESIQDSPSVDRCVEYRTILEKVRLIDQRLSYQLNKIITGQYEEDQRISISNLDLDQDSDEDEVYKPPKLKAVKTKH